MSPGEAPVFQAVALRITSGSLLPVLLIPAAFRVSTEHARLSIHAKSLTHNQAKCVLLDAVAPLFIDSFVAPATQTASSF